MAYFLTLTRIFFLPVARIRKTNSCLFCKLSMWTSSSGLLFISPDRIVLFFSIFCFEYFSTLTSSSFCICSHVNFFFVLFFFPPADTTVCFSVGFGWDNKLSETSSLKRCCWKFFKSSWISRFRILRSSLLFFFSSFLFQSFSFSHLVVPTFWRLMSCIFTWILPYFFSFFQFQQNDRVA